MAEITEEQRETLRFYTTNDYLLINGLLWGEGEDVIDEFIRTINADGRSIMKEAEEMGFSRRWNCTEEEGERIYELYRKRFPLINAKEIRDEIVARARIDIDNMMSCLKPLEEALVLYRNIARRYAERLKENDIVDCKGFSSCSLARHTAGNAMYGAGNSLVVRIQVVKGMPAIRLDGQDGVGNEPDEVILPPMKMRIVRIGADDIEAVAMERLPIDNG